MNVTTLNKRIIPISKRIVRCCTAMLLVIFMLLTVLPVFAQEAVLKADDIPEALTRAQLEAHGAIRRLYDKEQGDNDFIFLNADGTVTEYDFSVPVKYKDENGKYKDKSNKIKEWNGEYGNTASDVELRFPKQLNFIKIKHNGRTVRIRPVTQASPGQLPATVQDNSVSYTGAFGEGTTLRYTSTMSGIKEDIILQNRGRKNSFSFEVRTDGLELKEVNGVWGIYDGEATVFCFGDLEVTDSFTGENEATDDWDAHRTYAEAQVSALSGDKYIFTITVPVEYLQAETTVYPVYIDPSFNVSRTYIKDTYIAKGYTNNYVNSSLVAVGYGTNAKNVRTLAKISDILGGSSIQGRVTGAYYSMYCTSDYSSSPTVDTYMINEGVSWNPAAVTWQNSADTLMNGSTKLSTLTVKGAGRYNFDITSAYQAWQTGTENNGIMLRMTTEVSGKYRQFASANVSDSSKLAYITVSYDSVGAGITVNPQEAYMTVGEVKRISALAHSVNETITWSSSNPSVATVDTNGNVTAHSAGDVFITATGTYAGSSATCGITVVAKGVDSVTLPYRTLYITNGKTLNIPVRIAPSDASVQEVIWSSNDTSVVTVSNGVLRAVGSGTTTVTVRSVQGGKTDSMTVAVPEFEDGTYYLKNKATKKYLDIQGPSNESGAITHQWKMHGYASQQWEFELQTSGYYKIKSVHSGLYLSVENNSSEQNTAVVQKEFNNGSGQLWKVELLNDGAYKLTPKSGESTNRVLASAYYGVIADGIAVQQRLFVDDTNYKDEWILISRKLDIVNYYDSSIANTPTQAYIDDAVKFMSDVFYREFKVTINNKSISRYSNALADQCSLGNNSSCGNICGEHSQHHKNIYYMAEQLYNAPRDDNHVYVMWADRDYGVYCDGVQHAPLTATIAVNYSSRPVINFLTLKASEAENADKSMAKMSIVLAHEMAHVFGLSEIYGSGTIVDNKLHEDVECVMNKYVEYSNGEDDKMVEFYNKIKGRKAHAFCSSCTQQLKELTQKVLTEGNKQS